jgi:hypothetical protein
MRFAKVLSRMLISKVQLPKASSFLFSHVSEAMEYVVLRLAQVVPRSCSGRLDAAAQDVAWLGADNLFAQMYGDRIGRRRPTNDVCETTEHE